LQVWRAEDGHLVASLDGHADWVTNVKVYREPVEGRVRVVTSCDNSFKANFHVWDAQTGVQLRTHTNGRGDDNGFNIFYSSEGAPRVVSLNDQGIEVWDPEEGSVLSQISSGERRFRFLPSSLHLYESEAGQQCLAAGALEPGDDVYGPPFLWDLGEAALTSRRAVRAAHKLG
jgi:WD40 repeat protein